MSSRDVIIHFYFPNIFNAQLFESMNAEPKDTVVEVKIKYWKSKELVFAFTYIKML